MPRVCCLLLIMTLSQSCQNSEYMIDLQGHRGCMGIMPENTIEAFIKALEIGVTTLEMDLVISGDNQVVVSHEPYFAHQISTTPEGEHVTRKNERDHNMFRMSYEQIRQYDVGLRPHPDYPQQSKIPAYKPLLKDVITASENYATTHGLNRPWYNIEIKRKERWDDSYHPPVAEFVALVLEQVRQSGVSDRVCIQSFDIESLQIVKHKAPELTTALLIETIRPFDDNIAVLGFTPDIYSPNYAIVNKDLVHSCQSQGIRLIPWTVNHESDMLRMIDLEVDGIITDYPGKLKALLEDRGIPVQ